MSNFNKVFLMGRLTRDPELRYTPQGTAVCDIGLAVNREFTVDGEKRKDVLFIDVTLWRRQAEVAAEYLKKGSPIHVEGRLVLDSWQAQDGKNRQRHRVVAENFQFLGGGNGGAPTERSEEEAPREPGVPESEEAEAAAVGADIPF